ncbi:MAG: murein biosynthesis integral membrane protein MurJ, partial [Oligoflexia bacterium]|nr:murein biosynthesis integral membrane protein MurJ [Oligoflexia bacterium]
SALFTLLFTVLSAVTLLGIFNSDFLISTLTLGDRGFGQAAGKLELTAQMARIMFGYILLVSLYAFFMGILNTFRIFWLPAVAPALWNVSVIVAVLFFRNSFEEPAFALAWATLIGGVAQMVLLIPKLVEIGFFPKIRNWFGNPSVKRVLWAMGPSLIGLSVTQIAIIINTYFASSLSEGANSWIFYADRLLELPLSLFAVSLGTVSLPLLSDYWSRGQREEMVHAAVSALKMALFLALPCSAIIFVASEVIIRVLFEHGRFTAFDTEMTGQVLQIYGFGIIFASCVRVIAPAFFAMKNTWIPALAAALALIGHVLIAPLLMARLNVSGLAMSSTISGALNFLILVSAFGYFVGTVSWNGLGRAFIKFVVGASFSGLTCWSVHKGILSAISGGPQRVVEGFALALALVLAGIVYLGITHWLGAAETRVFIQAVSKRIKK